MSDLVPRPAGAAAPTDGDHRYKAVQHKLKTLETAMDGTAGLFEQLLVGMRMNSSYAENLAQAVAAAEVDPAFVEMTNLVSVALGGAGIEVRKLHAAAQEVTSLVHNARRTHARKYEALDDVRSSRRERTPKPGFLTYDH
ncbi:conjugal transfer protein TraB [Streptomyces filamentosus]